MKPMLQKLFTSGAGLGLIQSTEMIPQTVDYSEVIKIVTQIAIAVVTLISLFKQNKKS